MKRNAFVIMPFSATVNCTEEEWTEIFENVFKPALEGCNFNCERAVPSTGSLISSIVEKLRNSWLVIADITDRNPNVFYELGVRHSLSKRTLIVCQDAQTIPSDLKGYWSLEYGIRPAKVAKFAKDIARIVSEIESNPHRSDSPVSDYLEREQLSVLSYVQTENVKKLNALLTELSGNAIVFESIKDTPIEHMNYNQFHLIASDCLSLLIQTLYIDPGPKVLKQGYELMAKLRMNLRMLSDNKKLIDNILSHLKSFARGVHCIRNRIVSVDSKIRLHS